MVHGSLIVAFTVSNSIVSRLLIEPLKESVTGDDGSALNDFELGEIVLTHQLVSDKFLNRFKLLEESISKDGKDITKLSLAELDEYYCKVKENENK